MKRENVIDDNVEIFELQKEAPQLRKLFNLGLFLGLLSFL